jgi:hypothetical protein
VAGRDVSCMFLTPGHDTANYLTYTLLYSHGMLNMPETFLRSIILYYMMITMMIITMSVSMTVIMIIMLTIMAMPL